MSRVSFCCLFFAVLFSSLLGFLSLPLHWVFLGLASTLEAFAKLGSCCAWPLPCGGRTEVVSARLNLRNSTRDVRECVLFLVLSCHSKILKQWTSVTAQLQLSFIWQAKKNTSSRHEGNTEEAKKEERLNFASSFLYAFSPPF